MPFLKKLVAPPFCFYCRKYGDTTWCVECSKLIKPVLATRMMLDKSYVLEIHAASAYEDPLKALVMAKRWSDYSASVLLGRLVWYHSVLQTLPFDCLVPIPLHKSRLASRGYNQAQVMAQEISRLSGKPMYVCLGRIKNTVMQSTIPLTQRYTNVQDAFSFEKDRIVLRGKTVVLIDDSMTSGATLQAAAKVLIEACPEKIYSVVACRVL